MTYENNSAEYGNNIASYPVKIQMADTDTDTDSDELVMNNVGSGIQLDEPLGLKLVDYDNQTMVLDNSTQILIHSINQTQTAVKGFNAEILNQGVATFDGILFVSSPGSANVEFSVECKAIDTEKIADIFGTQL